MESDTDTFTEQAFVSACRARGVDLKHKDRDAALKTARWLAEGLARLRRDYPQLVEPQRDKT